MVLLVLMELNGNCNGLFWSLLVNGHLLLVAQCQIYYPGHCWHQCSYFTLNGVTLHCVIGIASGRSSEIFNFQAPKQVSANQIALCKYPVSRLAVCTMTVASAPSFRHAHHQVSTPKPCVNVPWLRIKYIQIVNHWTRLTISSVKRPSEEKVHHSWHKRSNAHICVWWGLSGTWALKDHRYESGWV